MLVKYRQSPIPLKLAQTDLVNETTIQWLITTGDEIPTTTLTPLTIKSKTPMTFTKITTVTKIMTVMKILMSMNR